MANLQQFESISPFVWGINKIPCNTALCKRLEANDVKTYLLTFKTSDVTSGSGHVTPSRSPFAVNVDLKVSNKAERNA